MPPSRCQAGAEQSRAAPAAPPPQLCPDPLPWYLQGGRASGGLAPEATRELLGCLLWVLKGADPDVLRGWLTDLPPARLARLLDLLRLCTAAFCYKVRGLRGRREGVAKEGCRGAWDRAGSCVGMCMHVRVLAHECCHFACMLHVCMCCLHVARVNTHVLADTHVDVCLSACVRGLCKYMGIKVCVCWHVQACLYMCVRVCVHMSMHVWVGRMHRLCLHGFTGICTCMCICIFLCAYV